MTARPLICDSTLSSRQASADRHTDWRDRFTVLPRFTAQRIERLPPLGVANKNLTTFRYYSDDDGLYCADLGLAAHRDELNGFMGSRNVGDQGYGASGYPGG